MARTGGRDGGGCRFATVRVWAAGLGDLEDGDEVAVFDADLVDEGLDRALAFPGDPGG
jgi:hypothetical protein